MSRTLRTSILALLVLAIVSISAFAAGEIGMNGTVNFVFKYDNAAKRITGWQDFKLDIRLKGTSLSMSLNEGDIGGHRNGVPFTELYPGRANYLYNFAPYRVTVDVAGKWFPQGPRVTTTFGDFNSGLPAYVSGHYNRNLYAGLKVRDIPVTDKATGLVFFGWPKFGDGHTLAGIERNKFYNVGTQWVVKDLVPGFELKLYGVGHYHQVPVVMMEIDGEVQRVQVGGTRGENMLVVVTEGLPSNLNPYGHELLVDLATGKVEDSKTNVLGTNENPVIVPAGKIVLSGHGTQAAWLKTFNIGDVISIAYEHGKTNMSEGTAGIEATGSIAGVNLNATVLGRMEMISAGALKETDYQLATRVNGDYTFVVDPVKVKVAGGFRYIDNDFEPFARNPYNPDPDGYKNPFDGPNRNQIGGNGAVTLTLPAKTTVDLTTDYYQLIEAADPFDRITGTLAVTNSNFFNVTAKASVTGTRQVKVTEVANDITDTVTSSASLARDWRLPTRDTINTTYSLSTTNLLKGPITFTNKLVAKGTVTLPYVNKVTLEATGTLVTVDGTTTPSVEGKLNYTFANNVTLEAKATKANKNPISWYAQMQYSLSF